MRLDFGETRHVRLEVFSKKQEEFEIKNASYELLRKGSKQVESCGEVSITEHILDAVVCPKFAGYYTLKIVYIIGDEKLIENVEIFVKE